MELIRITDNIEGDCVITSEQNQIFITTPEVQLISRVIDAQYPDYKRVIPNNSLASVIIKKQDLEKNIRMASIFSSSIADLLIKVVKNIITITAHNTDRGEIVSHVPCVTQGNPFELSVNYHYILDGLKAITTEMVNIHFTGQGSPLVIKPEGKNDYTYLIMPLRGTT